MNVVLQTEINVNLIKGSINHKNNRIPKLTWRPRSKRKDQGAEDLSIGTLRDCLVEAPTCTDQTSIYEQK